MENRVGSKSSRRSLELMRGTRNSHHESAGTGNTKEHLTWTNVLARCRNPKATAYPKYGAKGVTVCARWMTYENFLLDMGRAPSERHTIERIKNEIGYEPGNCRWATFAEQRRNQNRVAQVTYNGEMMCLADACAKAGMSLKLVWKRMNQYGWPFERAISDPVATRWERAARAA